MEHIKCVIEWVKEKLLKIVEVLNPIQKKKVAKKKAAKKKK
tara:strand:+ start:7301 stop:7423 length:123 start_codon:yes stop_codon:yes gene_type:complete